MDQLYVDENGWMIDSNGDYLVDQDGLPVTEEEYDAITAQEGDSFVDAITPGYQRLRTELGREPTDRELNQLLADAELTGDPNIDQAYERVTKRTLGGNLNDDETRVRVFAEYAEEAADADEDSAEALEAEG